MSQYDRRGIYFTGNNIIIVDKLVKLMGKAILRSILDDIKNIQWYAIIADEATDISGIEQMSVSICWVKKDYKSTGGHTWH